MAHAELIADLDTDEEVMRHLTGRARPREETLRDWVPLMCLDRSPGGQLGYWVGFEAEQFVGWWCLNPDDADPAGGELGYRLRRERWGQGLATEGARAMVEHGFATVGLDHVWAQTMAVNGRSRGVMERIGLRFERAWVGAWNDPIPGWELGEVSYGLSRDAWGTTPVPAAGTSTD